MNEKRKTKNEKRSGKVPLCRFSFFILRFSLAALAGCTSSHPTTQPASAADRQDAALRDPMGYRPDLSDANDISGGGIGTYDRKAMRKDIDNVLNP